MFFYRWFALLMKVKELDYGAYRITLHLKIKMEIM